MNITLDNQEIFLSKGGVEWQDDRATLILQHGAGMNRTVWVLLSRFFARHGFNIIAADLPGHGASKGEAIPTIEGYAQFVWSLVDELQKNHGLPEGPVVMGGHSMGALVAMEAAGQQPARVDHLLMLGTGCPMPVGKPLLDAAEANDQAAVNMITLYGHSFQSQLGHNHVAGISVQNAAMALLEGAAPGVLHNDLLACNNYQGLEKVAESFAGRKSTLIVGDSDRMTPMKTSLGIKNALNCDMTVLSNCGHMVMSEQPEQTLQAVRAALL